MFFMVINIIPFFIPLFLASWWEYNDYKVSVFKNPTYLHAYDIHFQWNRTLLLPKSSVYQIEYNFWFVWTEDFENRFFPWEIINSPDWYLYNKKLKNKVNDLYENICDNNLIQELWLSQIAIRKYVTLLNPENNLVNQKIIWTALSCWVWSYNFWDDQLIILNYIGYTNNLKKVDNTIFKKQVSIREEKRIVFPYLYNKWWGIFLWDEEVETQNSLIYDYANSWNISKDDIIEHVKNNYTDELKKQWYPKILPNWTKDYKYYIENIDWTLDIELTIYFKPQRYFYMLLIVSGLTFISLIFYILINLLSNKKKTYV
jgi:hypothetical protein